VAVPAVIRLFATSKRSIIQVLTAQTLGSIGPGAKEAVPVLLERLRDKKGCYKGLRDAILSAIERIDPGASPKATDK